MASNPLNPIINIRSFGENVEAVSQMVQAYVRGAQAGGQLACAKHFPGHGDVDADSHLTRPRLDVPRSRLDAVELPPFRAGIEAGVDGIMSAHIFLPQLEAEDGLPATLSPGILTGLLREQLGFDGLIFTDAMEMNGVAAYFDAAEATVRAVEAGADLVIFPVDLPRSFAALKQAVESGRISGERLDASVRRILTAKARLQLHRRRHVDEKQLPRLVGGRARAQLDRLVMESAVTLVRDHQQALPVTPQLYRHVLQVDLVDERDTRASGLRPGRAFLQQLRTTFAQADNVNLAKDFSSHTALDVLQRAQQADVLVINAFADIYSYKGDVGLSKQQIAFVHSLIALGKPLVFNVFGNPYLLMALPELPSYTLAYEVHPTAEVAICKAITGVSTFNGRLPISLPGLHPIGHGL